MEHCYINVYNYQMEVKVRKVQEMEILKSGVVGQNRGRILDDKLT